MTHRPTERVLRVFKLLANQKAGLTSSEIAKKLEIPKSTLSPILQTLLEHNFIAFSKENAHYNIGIATFSIGSSFCDSSSILLFAKKCMIHISETVGEVCHMGILDGPDVLYVLKEEPARDLEIGIISSVGKHLPAYATALGKALLSSCSKEELQNLYPRGLVPITERTITDFDELYEQIQNIRKDDISYEEEEVTLQICCYAIAVSLPVHGTVAISVSLPVFRVTPEKIELIKSLLLQIRDDIESI